MCEMGSFSGGGESGRMTEKGFGLIRPCTNEEEQQTDPVSSGRTSDNKIHNKHMRVDKSEWGTWAFLHHRRAQREQSLTCPGPQPLVSLEVKQMGKHVKRESDGPCAGAAPQACHRVPEGVLAVVDSDSSLAGEDTPCGAVGFQTFIPRQGPEPEPLNLNTYCLFCFEF